MYVHKYMYIHIYIHIDMYVYIYTSQICTSFMFSVVYVWVCVCVCVVGGWDGFSVYLFFLYIVFNCCKSRRAAFFNSFKSAVWIMFDWLMWVCVCVYMYPWHDKVTQLLLIGQFHLKTYWQWVSCNNVWCYVVFISCLLFYLYQAVEAFWLIDTEIPKQKIWIDLIVEWEHINTKIHVSIIM